MPTLNAALLCSSRAGSDLGCESGLVEELYLTCLMRALLAALLKIKFCGIIIRIASGPVPGYLVITNN